jgi:hypothetical protein
VSENRDAGAIAALLVRLSRSPLVYSLGVSGLVLIAFGELQYAGPLLALVHPTGQPLYVLIGKLWTEIIPFGSAAWRMNLLAAVCTAVGCGVVCYLFIMTFRNQVIGVAAGLTLGFGATIWGQAVLADKYSFNVLLAAMIIGLALWWNRDHGQPHGEKLLYALSLAFGLSLLHHRSMGLFAPGLGIMVVYHLRQGIWRNRKRTLISAALVVIPALVVYPTVLPWLRSREMTPLLWQPNDAQEWIDFMLERHVLTSEVLVFDDSSDIANRLGIYMDTVIDDYTPLVVIFSAFGFLAMLRRSLATGVFLLFSYGLQAFLSANFRGNERQFTYYLPSFVTLTYAYAFGLLTLWQVVKGRFQSVRMKQPARIYPIYGMATVLVLLIPSFQFASSYRDRREESIYGEPLDPWRETVKTGNMGERLVSGMDDLPRNAALAADWEQATVLWYTQQVEGVRPDLEIFYPIERYAEFDESDRAICLARHLPVGANWHPTNVDAFVCLNRQPQYDLPPNTMRIGRALFTPEGVPAVELTAYSLDAIQYRAGNHGQLLLFWRASADLDKDYSISLQILDESWQLVWSRDIQSPVIGMYPTSRWTEGEVVGDYHEIDIPRTMPPGRYLWTVVVYRQLQDGSFEQLHDDQGGVNILGGTFEVMPG